MDGDHNDTDEDNDDIISIGIDDVHWKIYLLILDIGDHNIIFLQNFETLDNTYAFFCAKQFTILNNIPPFRPNGNMTSSYHPMGNKMYLGPSRSSYR